MPQSPLKLGDISVPSGMSESGACLLISQRYHTLSTHGVNGTTRPHGETAMSRRHDGWLALALVVAVAGLALAEALAR
jgi:hypothetical protein